MKTLRWTPLFIVALLVAGSGSRANANLFSDNFEMLVVAERAKDVSADAGKPTSYVAVDGGSIEAGDPIAGDSAPTPRQVRQYLESALEAQGFKSGETTPNLVLIYHWGVIRIDHREISVPFHIKKNLEARIAVVSTELLGAEVDNHFKNRAEAGGENDNASSPTLLVGPLATVVQQARLPRIFIVVSAFDYQSLAQHHEAKLVWTAKLSAQESAGDMTEVIPPLIAKGAAFFGQDFPDVRIIQARLESHPSEAVPANFNAQPSPESYNLDKGVLNGLFRAQRIKYSGSDERPDSG